jgi:hypothetical protein
MLPVRCSTEFRCPFEGLLAFYEAPVTRGYLITFYVYLTAYRDSANEATIATIFYWDTGAPDIPSSPPVFIYISLTLSLSINKIRLKKNDTKIGHSQTRTGNIPHHDPPGELA